MIPMVPRENSRVDAHPYLDLGLVASCAAIQTDAARMLLQSRFHVQGRGSMYLLLLHIRLLICVLDLLQSSLTTWFPLLLYLTHFQNRRARRSLHSYGAITIISQFVPLYRPLSINSVSRVQKV